jgi:hypothetical protein
VAYEYEVFVSYRRANEWPRFIEGTFLPMFRHWLSAEMGNQPRIFFDAGMVESGHLWPRVLADGLARSKVMLCLWSREYFGSDWCLAELAHMLARRDAVAELTGASPPLLLPAVIHDGEHISPELGDIQRLNIQPFANPWMAAGSPAAEELSNHIRKFATHVAHAIEGAPDHDPGWSKLATDEFVEVYRRTSRQRTVPSLGGRPS